MNTELLTRVRDHIMDNPERFIMSRHASMVEPGLPICEQFDRLGESDPGGAYKFTLRPPCGTAACIAGWSHILGMPNPDAQTTTRMLWSDVQRQASRLLGINTEQAQRLFYLRNWPKELRDRFLDATLAFTRASVARERIDMFMATEGRV